jgi:hypothetical protein
MGNALGIAQFGGTVPTAKPWKGLGPGVLDSLSRTTDLVEQRRKHAQRDYEEHHGKTTR